MSSPSERISWLSVDVCPFSYKDVFPAIALADFSSELRA